MEFNSIGSKEILQLGEELGLELSVKERENVSDNLKYYCYFKSLEIMDSGFLVGTPGDGRTVDEAILDYCTKIQYKTVALRAYTKDRVNLTLPKLTHTMGLR